MVVLNNTKEANKQKIKEAYDNGKGIWFTITDEIASALIWDYTDRIDGTFEEERMGAGYAYYGTEEEETQSTTGKYAWWDEREMKKEPPDVQEWARQKRIQAKGWEMEIVVERRMFSLKQYTIPDSNINNSQATGE